MEVSDGWSKSSQRPRAFGIRTVIRQNYIWYRALPHVAVGVQMRCDHTKLGHIGGWCWGTCEPPPPPPFHLLHVHSLFLSANLTTHFNLWSSALDAPVSKVHHLHYKRLHNISISFCFDTFLVSEVWTLPPLRDVTGEILFKMPFSRSSNILKFQHNYIQNFQTWGRAVLKS